MTSEELRDRLMENYYKCNLPYPHLLPYKCSCGTLFSQRPDKAPNYCAVCGSDNVKDGIIAKKAEYDKEMKSYRESQDALNRVFQHDCFTVFDVQENPKRFKAWNIAYEYGHSCGNHEIYNYFSTIVELIK